MKTEHKIHPTNQFINTKDHLLHIGNTYLYKEGKFETKVELVAVTRNQTTWDFIIKHQIDKYNIDGDLQTEDIEMALSFSIQVLNTEYDGAWQLSEIP